MKINSLTVATYSLCTALSCMSFAFEAGAEPMSEKARCTFVQQRPTFSTTTTIRLSHAFSRDAARMITSSAVVEVARTPARPGQSPFVTTIGNDDIVVRVGPSPRGSESGGGSVDAGYLEVSTRNGAFPFLVAYHPNGTVRGLYTPTQPDAQTIMNCVPSADTRTGSMHALTQQFFADMQEAANAFRPTSRGAPTP